MDKKRRWRIVALWALVVFSVLYTLPTFVGRDKLPEWYTNVFSKQLNYGLDLQGGLELRYTVDWKRAIEDNTRKLGDTVRAQIVDQLARKENRNPVDLTAEQIAAYQAGITVQVPEYNRLQLQFKDKATADLLDDEILEQLDSRFVLSRESDTTFELTLPDEQVAEIREQVVRETRGIISKRVEAFGLVDPDVRTAGLSDIAVQIPGVSKAQMETVRQRIGQTAQLTLRMVDESNTFFAGVQSQLDAFKAQRPDSDIALVPSHPTGPYVRATRKSDLVRFVRTLDIPADRVVGYEETEITEGNIVSDKYWRTYLVEATAAITGDHLARSQVLYDEKGIPYVSLDFNAEGGRIFADVTERNVQEYMAIMLDENVASAPIINEKIGGGRAQITMGAGGNPQRTLNEARGLVTVLNQGAYKAPVYKVHDHEVGPSLGADSVSAGTTSMAVGGALVIMFMLLYYRASGIIAVTVLLFNMLLILVLLVSLNSALTLPGMAGIILTIGMAVDANIIIFERIREELSAGKSPRAAVDAGYEKAFSTILDANVTTALAGVILLNYTSGPIRGFAVTLLIGIVCSVFTAVYVSRVMFNWWLARRPATLSIG